MPLYPMLDNYDVTDSSHQITDNRVWNREANEKAWQMYLGEEAKGDVSPGTFHGFENLIPAAEVSKKARNEYLEALNKALNGVPLRQARFLL